MQHRQGIAILSSLENSPHHVRENVSLITVRRPASTLSIEGDTAAYTYVIFHNVSPG